MEKEFCDMCYEILSHYLHFLDVANTFKSIQDGIMYLNNYPINNFVYQAQKDKIIAYILSTRIGNIIYQYHENHVVFVPLPTRGKWLNESTRDELRVELEIAVSMLKLKGIHQVIKHLYAEVSDDALSGELLGSDRTVFDRYGLR